MAQKCLTDKFRGKCERYWPKNPFKKTVSGAIFSPTPLADATYKKKFLKRLPLMLKLHSEKQMLDIF